MSYIKNNLMPNEKILFSARIHPIIFLSPTILWISCLSITGYALTLINQQDETNKLFFASIYFLLACLLLFHSITFSFRAVIYFFATEFGVTNKRIIAKTGFIRRHTLEMLLPKIESVSVKQNILDRLFNSGTVTVIGTGGTKENFRSIYEPLTIRKNINQIIEKIS